MQQDLRTDHESAEMLAFEIFLRTGLKIDPRVVMGSLEAKYNHNHDPENGQFTYSDGAIYSGRANPQGVSTHGGHNPRTRTISRARRRVATSLPEPKIPLRIAQRRNDGRPLPYLSPLHNETRALAVGVPPERGTSEWTPVEFASWKLAGGDIHAFKRQWVHGYRDATKAAARRFDLPAGLVAGVAYTEVGGDPLIVDPVAYNVRDLVGSPKRDRTSLGNLSVQFRRAAQALGYDPNHLVTGPQRAMLLNSLQDPQVNIFIAAKHLSDLRNVDFKGTPGSRLTLSQIQVIASRYNQGPDLSRQQIEHNLSYGRSVTKRWHLLNHLLK